MTHDKRLLARLRELLSSVEATARLAEQKGADREVTHGPRWNWITRCKLCDRPSG